jgi:hypothetical protein
VIIVGGVSREEAHVEQQLLSDIQEAVLVQWNKVHDHRGVPLGYASQICGKHVGVSWPKVFVKRQKIDLKTKRTAPLENARAKALNYTNVMKFYKVFEELVTKYNVKPENVFNSSGRLKA